MTASLGLYFQPCWGAAASSSATCQQFCLPRYGLFWLLLLLLCLLHDLSCCLTHIDVPALRFCLPAGHVNGGVSTTSLASCVCSPNPQILPHARQ